MARKTRAITITAGNRDKGKVFVLHEMPAMQAEWWFIRLVGMLANAGAKVPENVLFAGAAGFAEMLPTLRNSLIVAMRALQGLDAYVVKPLLDEMLPYIKWKPPGPDTLPLQELFPGEACQAEEPSTLLFLRFELIQLHVGFSLVGGESTTEMPGTPQAPPT